MADPELESLVYVSSAVKLLSIAEITHLLEKARDNNKKHGVTGLLLYIGGNFMQYIEGPADGVDVIYDIVQRDKKHTGIILISREKTERRLFADWSMAFQTRELEGYVGSPKEKGLLDTILQRATDHSNPAQIVLRSFWERSGS